MQLAVGLDFDHTLGVDHKVERTVGVEIAERLAKLRGLAFDREAAVQAFDEALAATRLAGIPIETAIEGALLRSAGPGPENEDEVGHFRDEVILRAPQFVEALPGAKEMLASLDALGVRYAILTNGWSPFQEEKARLIGFRAPVYVSERIGARKPARESFALLGRQFGLPLEAIWYLGNDAIVDCAGARDAGLTAVWYDWEHRPYPAGVQPANYVIASLEEFPLLVQGHLTGAAKPAAQ
jgi:HAD superfamily hydrolase (TIGR01549 family)